MQEKVNNVITSEDGAKVVQEFEQSIMNRDNKSASWNDKHDLEV